MKFFLNLFIICLLPLPLWAEVYKGKIIDHMTGDPLPGAIIQSSETNHTQSDEEGNFLIETDDPNIVVSLMGFSRQRSKLNNDDNVIALSIRSVFEVQSVKVKAKRDAKKVVVSKQYIQKEAIKKTTTTLFADVASVIQTMPGVTTDSDFSGLLFVRGGEPDEVVSILDEMIIMNPYIWGGRLTMFNPNMVDDVEFYAGGFPAEANQGMSALLNIKNRVGNPDKFTGFIDLSAATADVVLEGPCFGPEDSSFLFGIRRTHYDLIIDLFTDSNTVYPFFYDGQVKFNLPFKNGTLQVQSVFSYEGMNFKMEDEDEEGYGSANAETSEFHYRVNKNNSSISYDHHLTEDISVLTLLGVRYTLADLNWMSTFDPMNMKIDQYFLQLRHIWQALIGDHHIFKAGCYGITGVGQATTKTTIKVPTFNNSFYEETIDTEFKYDWPVFAGFFVQDDMEIIEDKLYINPGLNIQYFSGNNQWVPNPRLGFKYKINPDWEVHLASGLYTQHPMEYQLLDTQYGNPELKAQEAIHYIFGTKLDIGEDWFIQCETYYKDYSNLFTSDPDPDIRYTNNTKGYACGLDVILQKKLSEKWDGWLTYSYVQSNRKIDRRSNPQDFGQNPYAQQTDAWYPSDSERPHAFSMVLNYKFDEKWKVALTQKYFAGKPYTPIESGTYQPAIDEYVPVQGDYNSARMPDFTTTDIKITMPFFWDNWSSYIQVSNLFDVKNVEQYQYKTDYSGKREMHQLPRMVIGGLKWTF